MNRRSSGQRRYQPALSGFTSIVHRTGSFTFSALSRHACTAFLLVPDNGDAAMIALQLSGAAACIKRCPASHGLASLRTWVAMRSGQRQLGGMDRAIGPASAA